MKWLQRRRARRWVHPDTHRIVKLLPNNPPTKGDVVSVDGQRCRVLRSKVRWEGLRWTLDGPILVLADERKADG
jgi:hypothetical protein